MSLASTVAGFGLLALLPAYRISVLHIIFIGGFTQAILTVAARVILGHSGELGLVRSRLKPLLLLAMISRFVADFVPTRNEHLLWGAVCWLVAVAIWAVIVLPRVTKVEDGG